MDVTACDIPETFSTLLTYPRLQAERQALRAVELARMRTILRLRLVARLWARAARASAAKRAALRFGAMRLGAPLVAQIKLELQVCSVIHES